MLPALQASLELSHWPPGSGPVHHRLRPPLLCFDSVPDSAAPLRHREKRTHPLQRIVFLGVATTASMAGIFLMMLSWETGGLWKHGEPLSRNIMSEVCSLQGAAQAGELS